MGRRCPAGHARPGMVDRASAPLAGAGSMTFEQPWALLLVPPAVAVVLLIAHHGRTVVGRRQSRWARAVRVVGVTVLCLAIAQPHMILPSGDQTVVFLLDRSDSVSEVVAGTQEQVLREALQSVPASARWSVVLFGAETRTDRSLAVGDRLPEIVTEVEGSATDLGGALRAVAALMPSAGSRRRHPVLRHGPDRL